MHSTDEASIGAIAAGSTIGTLALLLSCMGIVIFVVIVHNRRKKSISSKLQQ